jgi:hypothetical protein
LNGSSLPPTVVVRNETNRSIFGTSARTVLDPSRPASSRRLGLGHLQTKAQHVPRAIANPPDSQLALAEPPQKHPRDEHASERENEASFLERLYEVQPEELQGINYLREQRYAGTPRQLPVARPLKSSCTGRTSQRRRRETATKAPYAVMRSPTSHHTPYLDAEPLNTRWAEKSSKM